MTMSPSPELTQIRFQWCERHKLGLCRARMVANPPALCTGNARAMHDLSSERRSDRADLAGPAPSDTAQPCRRSSTPGGSWLCRCQGRDLHPALRAPYYLRAAAARSHGSRPLLLRRPTGGSERMSVKRLQPQDLRLQSFSVQRELPSCEVVLHTQIDSARETALIAVRQPSGGAMQAPGAFRTVSDPDNVNVKFAIIERSSLKGRKQCRAAGDDHEILGRQGAKRIVCQLVREDPRMRGWVRSRGFVVDAFASEGDAEANARCTDIPGSQRAGSLTTGLRGQLHESS